MATCDPTTVMADGKCFQCLGPREMDAARLQLLCDLKAQLVGMGTAIDNLITIINNLQAGPTHEDLVYAATTILNFEGADYQTIALTGNVDFASSLNRPVAGRAKSIAVIIECDNTDRTLAFNANWTFMGQAPTEIRKNTVAVLYLTAMGPAETDVVCAYYIEGGPTHEDLTYATPMTLNFDGCDYQTVALTGNINFSASSNRPATGNSKAIAVIIEADGSDRTLSFNANWTFVGAAPTDITANKVGILSLTAVGPNETDVIAAYQVEE